MLFEQADCNGCLDTRTFDPAREDQEETGGHIRPENHLFVFDKNYEITSMDVQSATTDTTPCNPFAALFQKRHKGNDDDIAPKDKNKDWLNEAEKMLSDEMLRLTVHEREDAYMDIHGIPSDNTNGGSDEIGKRMKQEDESNPEFIHYCKGELETKLLSLIMIHQYDSDDHEKEERAGLSTANTVPAYQIAMKQSPDYVRGLYTTFLRNEDYDIQATVEKIQEHFEVKRELFGCEKLAQEITLADLDPFDLETLESGCFQLLPQRDRSGRAIFLKVWDLLQYRTQENLLRTIWYTNMVALTDLETQRKGSIVIQLNSNPNWISQQLNKTKATSVIYSGLLPRVAKVVKAIPSKKAAVHYCFEDAKFGAIIKTVTSVLQKHSRTRTRMHRGTSMENAYALLSFGIPAACIPIDNDDGNISLTNHKQFLRQCQIREEYQAQQQFQQQQRRAMMTAGLQQQQQQAGNEKNIAMNGRSPTNMVNNNTPNIVVVPSPKDILYGRGTTKRMHVGNMKLNMVLEERGEEYNSNALTKKQKVEISRSVVQKLKDEGSRFLKQDKDSFLWWEVDDKTAADKVSHGFRNRRPTSTSSTTSSKKNKNGDGGNNSRHIEEKEVLFNKRPRS